MIEFREIPGHHGYRAGDDGSIWSCWAQKRRPTGYGTVAVQTDRWHQLKATRTPRGYLRLQLGKGIARSVHRLVLSAFAGPAPNVESQARHINGDRLDNRPSNLEWGTAIDNAADKHRHGKTRRGARGKREKLTLDQVRIIRARAATGESRAQLARAFGVTLGSIENIIGNRTWKATTHGAG